MSGERGFSLRIPAGLGTWIFFAPFAAFLILIAWTTGSGLWMQYWRLRTYVPVQAVVISSEAVQRGEGENTWEPVVHYRYPADAPLYTDTRVPPIRTLGSESWAWDLASRFAPGDRVTAYHDRVHHGHAFLLREPQYRSVPWFLFSIAILSVGMYLGRTSRERPPLQRRRVAGELSVRPRSPTAGLSMRPLRIVIIAALAGCAGHPDRVAQEPVSPLPAPPEAVTLPKQRAVEQRVALCVVRERQIVMLDGVIDPETGDSLLAGRPWREVHSEHEAPYAAANPWYISGRGLLPPGRQFPMDKFGLTRVLAPGDLRYWGEYEGVPVFVEAGSEGAMPDAAYVPVRPGCEFQPYMQVTTYGPVRG